MSKVRRLAAISAVSLSVAASAPSSWAAPLPPLLAGAEGFADRGLGGIRGITVGPIESSRHADKGYGTEASARSMVEARTLGASWVSLTPFGRTWDLAPTGIDLTFETPFEENRKNVLRAIHQAHAEGLKVFLVPHLWVESGGWRALIDPGDDAAWARWTDAYRSFLLTWAEVAAEGGVEMLSVGVELRSWVTTSRAASMLAIIADVRRVYPGWLTYSANWDDVGDTAILGAVDMIGINAFYPLAEREGASPAELAEGGRTDGVFTRADAVGAVVFREGPAPTRVDIANVAARVEKRLRRWLRRRGLLDEPREEDRSNEAPEPSPLEACRQLSLVGSTSLRVSGDGAAVPIAVEEARFRAAGKGPWVAEASGFNVHAGVTIYRP